MALCTEAQWAKACAQVEGTELAQTETWTATAEGGRGFVVRGGAVGCMARKIARGSEASPERAGVCCDRAIAIAGGTDSASFMRSTADQLMEFERALNAADLKKLESLVDEHITMIDKSYDRAAWLGMVGARLRGLKAQWILHDTCEVAVIGSGDESKWSADCRVIIREDDRVAFLVRRYVRGGSAGKLQSIGEPEVYRTFGPL